MNGQDHEVDAVDEAPQGKARRDEEDADGIEDALALFSHETREESVPYASGPAAGASGRASGASVAGIPGPGVSGPGVPASGSFPGGPDSGVPAAGASGPGVPAAGSFPGGPDSGVPASGASGSGVPGSGAVASSPGVPGSAASGPAAGAFSLGASSRSLGPGVAASAPGDPARPGGSSSGRAPAPGASTSASGVPGSSGASGPAPGASVSDFGVPSSSGASGPGPGASGQGAPASGHGASRHRATPWPGARALAARLGRGAPVRTRRVPLDQALGRTLAEPLTALCDLPSFDTSAMDGWVVAGPGPWSIQGDGSILAGHGEAAPLPDGAAVRIATGARIPPEATAVVRSEHSRTDADKGRLYAEREVIPGQDIRPRGQECRSGDQLLPAACVVTPAVLGLAAAAGYDELLTVSRPRVEVLVLGDELLTAGLPHDGLIRDALGPMIGPWLRALGAEVVGTRRLGDDAEALHQAVTTSEADLLITTGGTAAGPVDHVHPVLRKAGAELLVDGVAVRPGHPMLLARLAPEGDLPARHLVGLPGNPLAAVSGLLTLAEPLLRELAGRQAHAPYRVPVRGEVHGHPHDTRLVPVLHRAGQLVPLHYNGPAMLRGIAAADGLAVVPPGGARAGDELEVLDLPWTPGTPWSAQGGVSRETSGP